MPPTASYQVATYEDSTLSYRLAPGQEPVLVINGKDVPSDAIVSLPALAIAWLAQVAAQSGVAAGRALVEGEDGK